MRVIRMVVVAAIFVLWSGASLCLAAATATRNVRATVPAMNQSLSLAVSRITPGTPDVWTPATEVDFGTLTHDTANHIFRAAVFYAIDVGVVDNTNAWTLTHTRTSLKMDAANNLDDNVNVAFVKQTSDTAGAELNKVSFNNSNAKSFTKSQLNGGWLRIYYGVATGSGDATGVVPIPETRPSGNYQGTITLTLTP